MPCWDLLRSSYLLLLLLLPARPAASCCCCQLLAVVLVLLLSYPCQLHIQHLYKVFQSSWAAEG
jgi:hypothetical protein